jgi:glycosyltransferase involved in cell wall biosynthesis
VTIGIPVYNGENYLEEAVDSVLSQSYADLELVIVDNASEDKTDEICQDYSVRDQRVRYFRNSSNLGAAPNYNKVFSYARGKYFKWLAHDDRLLPSYVETTVAALDEHPEVVLCNTIVDYIGPTGEPLGTYKTPLSEAGVQDPAMRFAAMILPSHTCVDFFGMIRRSAMEGSILHQSFSGADKAFLAQMALRGRMLQLESIDVQMREHPGRYTRATRTSTNKLAWHNASLAGQRDIPVLTLYRTYRQLVKTEDLTAEQRGSCLRVLRLFWFHGWNSGRLLADVLSVPFPSMVGRAFDIKYRLFGAPGNFHRDY